MIILNSFLSLFFFIRLLKKYADFFSSLSFFSSFYFYSPSKFFCFAGFANEYEFLLSILLTT
jgi:hypothetical protein